MTIDLFTRIHDLPVGYSTRATHPDDAPEVTELVRQVDIAACGETSTTVEEISSDINSSIVRGSQGSAVVTHEDRIVAIAVCFDEVQDDRGLFLHVFASPTLPLTHSTAICESLISAATEYAKEIASTAKRQEVVVKTALYEADAGFLGALRNCDFEQHRVLWRMRRNTSEPLVDIQLPIGYEIVDFIHTDENMRELHALQSSAFMDYYDYSPSSFEHWETAATEGTNDPSLWRVVTFDGKIAGFLMGSNRFASEGFGYVAAIGVAREHRSKGLAKALLMDLFALDTKAGRIGTLLHGDSSNPTGAMVLYESVGMKVDRVYVAFKKTIQV